MNGSPASLPGRSVARRGVRVPVAVWILLVVVVCHALAFWVLADKHFLPKTPYIPPRPPANFGARQQTRVDPRTGEVTTETEYVVSTHLATPTPPEKKAPESALGKGDRR